MRIGSSSTADVKYYRCSVVANEIHFLCSSDDVSSVYLLRVYNAKASLKCRISWLIVDEEEEQTKLRHAFLPILSGKRRTPQLFSSAPLSSKD